VEYGKEDEGGPDEEAESGPVTFPASEEASPDARR
jgi:hypothetical protein